MSMEKLKITITNVKILNNYFTGSYNTDIHKGIIREVGGSSNYCVLLSLVSHADNTTKESYPSIETIANEIGASTRTVIRILADLEKRGYITRELVNSTKSRQKHNIYTLHLSEYAPEDENNGSDVERLFAHFKNKFREKYIVEYKSECGVESDLRDLEKIYNECNQDFDYACKVIDNHIDSYVGTKKYETPNIYFLLKYRLVEMKKKVGKELKQQERINKPQKPRGRYVDFVEDDADKVIPIDPNEFNEFLSEQAEKKRKIANF